VLTLLALEQTKQETLKGDGEKKTETTISTKTTTTTSALFLLSNFPHPNPYHSQNRRGKKDAKGKCVEIERRDKRT
jgi:hypothetical protein